jgi:hypothetical protein
MMKKSVFPNISAVNMILTIILFSISLLNAQEIKKPITQGIASSAPEWDALFQRKKGWFGGDGIFAIPLDGKEYVTATDSTKTLFIFSDSVLGQIGEDGTLKKREDFSFVNNAVALLKGSKPTADNFQFFYPEDKEGKPTSVFKPNTPQTKPGEYFWLGDGFVNVDKDSTLYIFSYRITHIEPISSFFDFDQVSVTLLAIPKNTPIPFEKGVRQIETPLLFPYSYGLGNTTFGSGIIVNTKSAGAPNPDGYIYVLGTGGLEKDLLIARVKPEYFENFDQWTYWDGAKWNADKTKVRGVTKGVSNELSMSPADNGRWILVHQLFGMTPEVSVQMTKSITGPYFPTRNVWHCPELDEDLDYYAYNAKAYPHLSKPGELLISYNVNSFDFFKDILTDPTHCRPRFITIKIH